IDSVRGGLGQIASATSRLIPALSQEADSLQSNLAFKNARINYATAGLHYDDGEWIGQAELGRSRSTSAIIPHGTMWYAGLARRIGDWTPFVLFSGVRPADDVRMASTDWTAIGQA